MTNNKQALEQRPFINWHDIADVEIDGVGLNDYPDFCDAYVLSAIWANTGIELTEKECQLVTEQHGDEVNILSHESFQ